VADLQDAHAAAVQVKHRLGGFFKDLLRQDTRAGAEVVDFHGEEEKLERLNSRREGKGSRGELLVCFMAIASSGHGFWFEGCGFPLLFSTRGD
jgi:hypothetical protein